MNYRPPFQVSANAIRMIAEIAALVERHSIKMEHDCRLRLRRANRVKTIQATLAIEGNSLSEEQVSEILDGKRVTGPLREIQEVRNAIAVYDIAQTLDPYSMEDFLKAHGMMMSALIDEPGVFRHGGAGVVKGDKVIHLAPPAHRVPELIEDLFMWLHTSEDHPLIQSSVFHYELEFIHPFADGNGRIGRLWQSLILAKWNPIFLQLPVETMVFNNQNLYYQAINESSAANDSGIFIDFMLRVILKTLHGHETSQESTKSPTDAVFQCILACPGIRAGMLAEKLSISRRTAERHLQALKNAGMIEFRGAPRNGGYYLK